MGNVEKRKSNAEVWFNASVPYLWEMEFWYIQYNENSPLSKNFILRSLYFKFKLKKKNVAPPEYL